MTTTHHTSLFRFDFSSPSQNSPLILLDLTDLQNSRQDNASISVDAESGRMTGSAKFLPSFGSGNYVLHFCADFHGASIRDNGIFADSRASADVKDLLISRSINGFPLPGGGFVRFGAGEGPLLARIATSFISQEQACAHAEQEIGDFDFERVRAASEDLWRKKLSPIKIDFTGVDADLVTNFYSGVYRTMVNPQDYTGENPLWKSEEPYFDSFYW